MSEDDYDYGVLSNAPTDYYDIPSAEEKEEEPKEDLNSKFEALERKNKELESKLGDMVPRSYETTYKPPTQTNYEAPQSIDPKKIEEEFWKNPAGTLQAFAVAAKDAASKEAEAKFVPMAAMVVRNQIQFYKQGASMDGEVEKEFNKLVEAIPDADLARADHKQLKNQLDMLNDMAHGRAARSGWVPQAARQAPNYGGGRSTPPPKPGAQRMQLSKIQQQALEAAKAVPGFDKWSPKEVAAFLKEYED